MDKNMQPNELRRYENLMSNLKPILIILLILVAAFCIWKFTDMSNEKYSTGKKYDYFNRIVNYFTDKYEIYTGTKKTFPDTPVQKPINSSVYIPPLDTTSLINVVPPQPKKVKSNSPDATLNWEEQYDSLKIKYE